VESSERMCGHLGDGEVGAQVEGKDGGGVRVGCGGVGCGD
jgi:hypothetical protein